jgi:hypothetical protein
MRAAIAKHGKEFRRLLIPQLLFSGSLTGKRLEAAFGDLCHQITWEEASLEIAGDPMTICHPDPIHIHMMIDYYQPDIVLTFGVVAGEAVASLWSGKLIRAPHPAARRADTLPKLREAAAELRRLYASHNQVIMRGLK